MILSTENLTINFGGLLAVNKVNFQVAEREIVGLIGPNGSGKSTFFNLVTGIYKPTRGEVLFKGRSIKNLPSYQITRKGIARTFQSSRLFLDLSVLDNVLVGMHCRQKIPMCLWAPRPTRSRLPAEIAGCSPPPSF